ncbi:MAG: hypothetical protein PHC56_04490 [Herbinix sp.]|nr:hypothetical protein [Herbinix sp.]
MIVNGRKIFIIGTFIIVMAIVVVLCVGYFTEDKKTEYDGVLVINTSIDLKEEEG